MPKFGVRLAASANFVSVNISPTGDRCRATARTCHALELAVRSSEQETPSCIPCRLVRSLVSGFFIGPCGFHLDSEISAASMRIKPDGHQGVNLHQLDQRMHEDAVTQTIPFRS